MKNTLLPPKQHGIFADLLIAFVMAIIAAILVEILKPITIGTLFYITGHNSLITYLMGIIQA